MTMPQGLREGLGGELISSSGIGALAQNPFFSGNVQATGSIVAAGVANTGATSTVGLVNTGSQTVGGVGVIANVGSPYGMGLVVPMTARTIISGGTWVGMSGGLAMAGPASMKQPLGVSVPGVTTASGGTVNVIVYGIVPVIAEGTIAINAPCMVGAGAALNCVVASDSGSGTRSFSTLSSVGSEGVVFIRL